MRRLVTFKFIVLMVFVLVGCTSIGTRILPKNRQGFGGAMIVSEEQQLLLNLVRIQFEDRPVFVNVDTITSSNTLTSGVSGQFSYTTSPNRQLSLDPDILTSVVESFSLSRFFEVAPSVSYSDSPTISFSPLQGEAFMRHILKPISMPDVYLLISSEWSPDRALRIVFERIYNNWNDSRFSDRGVKRIPENERFMELTLLLSKLLGRHMIYFSTSNINHATLPKGMTREQFELNENFK